jgi:hypothetical protein
LETVGTTFRDKDDPKPSSPLTLLKNYLSTPEKPVSSAEFRAFWMSCSTQERAEYAEQAQRDLEQ